jgi:hypothetical protein
MNGLTWDGEVSYEVPDDLPDVEDPAFARRRAAQEAQDPERNRRLMFGENDEAFPDEATWRLWTD